MIKVTTIVKTTPEKAWACFTGDAHVVHWNFASDDWHCPMAKNDLSIGGRFLYQMASKDGSMSFPFEGAYTEIVPFEKIEYVMDDARRVIITFESTADGTVVTEQFDPETQNAIELQQQGWQAILDNYARHVHACVKE
jgi:uncharacterized protein YndB with AHSA1/START domain